jgi:hypothetical protein
VNSTKSQQIGRSGEWLVDYYTARLSKDITLPVTQNNLVKILGITHHSEDAIYYIHFIRDTSRLDGGERIRIKHCFTLDNVPPDADEFITVVNHPYNGHVYFFTVHQKNPLVKSDE